jgi:hypothetical protein
MREKSLLKVGHGGAQCQEFQLMWVFGTHTYEGLTLQKHDLYFWVSEMVVCVAVG